MEGAQTSPKLACSPGREWAQEDQDPFSPCLLPCLTKVLPPRGPESPETTVVQNTIFSIAQINLKTCYKSLR